MKKIIFYITLLAILAGCGDKPYDESADAKADISNAINQAKIQHLPVVLIFGANWCEECRALSATIKTGKNSVKIAQEFKLVKVNVGDFDTNLDIASHYGNPISGGVPGAVILNANNKLLYVTKPGELSIANRTDDGIYNFLKKVSKEKGI